MAVVIFVNRRLQPVQLFLAGHGVHRAVDVLRRDVDHFGPLSRCQRVIIFLSIVVENIGNTLGIADVGAESQGRMHEAGVDFFQVIRIVHGSLGKGIDAADELGGGIGIDFRIIRADGVL